MCVRVRARALVLQERDKGALKLTSHCVAAATLFPLQSRATGSENKPVTSPAFGKSVVSAGALIKQLCHEPFMNTTLAKTFTQG